MATKGNLGPLTPYHVAILAVGTIITALCVVFVWPYSPQVAASVAAGLIVALLLGALRWMRRLPSPPRIWPNRNSVKPSLQTRMEQAERSLFLVGFSLGWTLKDTRTLLRQALNANQRLHVKMLLLNPDSPHARAHEPFSTRSISKRFGAAEDHLWDLYHNLSDDARRRLQVRATHYLPRFAARVFDGSTMLLNFYLYHSVAHVNPVIELRKGTHWESFESILGSLEELFDYSENVPAEGIHPNIKVIEDGRWYGLLPETRARLDGGVPGPSSPVAPPDDDAARRT